MIGDCLSHAVTERISFACPHFEIKCVLATIATIVDYGKNKLMSPVLDGFTIIRPKRDIHDLHTLPFSIVMYVLKVGYLAVS